MLIEWHTVGRAVASNARRPRINNFPFLLVKLWWSMASVTSLGIFWKILATHFLTKIAQIFGDIVDYCEKWHFQNETALATFVENLATLYSNILSHWPQQEFYLPKRWFAKCTLNWNWNWKINKLIRSDFARNKNRTEWRSRFRERGGNGNEWGHKITFLEKAFSETISTFLCRRNNQFWHLAFLFRQFWHFLFFRQQYFIRLATDG